MRKNTLDWYRNLLNPLPINFKNDIVEAFATSFFYYKKVNGKKSGFCSKCKTVFEVDNKYRAGAKVECPHCHKKDILIEADLMNPKPYNESFYMQYIENCLDFYIIRTFSVQITTLNIISTNIILKEIEMEIFREEHSTYYSQQINENYIVKWTNKRYKTSYASNLGIAPKYVYYKNLDKVFENSCYKNCAISEFAKNNMFDIAKYLRFYISYPMIENLVHLKLNNLTKGFINGYCAPSYVNLNEKSIYKFLKLENKIDLNFVIEHDMTWNQLDTFKKFNDIKKYDFDFIKTIAPAFRYCNSTYDYDNLLFVYNYYLTQIKIKKVTFSTFLSDYNDYENQVKKLNYNLKDTAICKPYDFYKMHTIYSELLYKIELEKEAKQNVEIDKYFNEHYVNRFQYLEYQGKNYSIILPKSKMDFLLEGKLLQHCVGGYFDRCNRMETIILFIRRNEALDKPFYTLNLTNNLELIQNRGFRNCSPISAVNDFVKEFLNKKCAKNQLNIKNAIVA